MTGGGDIIKKGMDKVNDAKSMAGDTISAVVGDGDSDPTMNRVQFKPKDYRVSKLLILKNSLGSRFTAWDFHHDARAAYLYQTARLGWRYF